jgi:hypothetical protein
MKFGVLVFHVGEEEEKCYFSMWWSTGIDVFLKNLDVKHYDS